MAGSGRAGYGCSDGLRHGAAPPHADPACSHYAGNACAHRNGCADSACDLGGHGHSQADFYGYTGTDGAAHAGQSHGDAYSAASRHNR